MKNKHLLAICVALVICISATNHVSAQGVAFNASGAAADASAMVDIASTSKGMLIPRMTNAQMMAIPAPATGLLVFQTDGVYGYYFFNGGSWVALLRGSAGTTNYIPIFSSAGTLGNSIIYQNPAASNRIGINYGTTNHGLLALKATVDTEALYINQNSSPSAVASGSSGGGYGVLREEYTGPNDNQRTGILATMIKSISDVQGLGIEGAGNSEGVLGYAEASSTSGGTVIGTEGDSYYDGAGNYSVGIFGQGQNYTAATSTCYGVYGTASGGATNYAGYFQGNVRVTGSMAKGSGTFEIDHPLDPANKYLYHSFVESPDMMNIYNGNITTDASGAATVKLPDYFEALNKDFRYQLTVIGTFAQAIISEKVHGNTFTIKTSVPNVEVSWMVTGVRQDAYANAHRVMPEVEKGPNDKGKYLYPKEMGQPAELGIGADIKGHGRKNDPAIMSKGTSGQK